MLKLVNQKCQSLFHAKVSLRITAIVFVAQNWLFLNHSRTTNLQSQKIELQCAQHRESNLRIISTEGECLYQFALNAHRATAHHNHGAIRHQLDRVR